MPARTPITAEQESQVLAMYGTRARLSDITEATGLPRSSIYWVLEKNGQKPNRIRRSQAEAVESTAATNALHEEIGELRSRLRALARITLAWERKELDDAAANAAQRAVLGEFMD